MSGSLANTAVLVTGASRGIGRAIAIALGREGARLGLLARSAPDLQSTADAVQRVGGAASIVLCDLADLDSIPGAVRYLRAELGGVDVLVNNAGVFVERPLENTSLGEWEHALRVNATAPFVVCRELMPHFRSRGRGRVVNIASTAAIKGYTNQAAYCASKHALVGMSRALALEAKAHGVHVHSVCPGGVDTDFVKGTQLGERIAGQSVIATEDIARLVVFLLEQPPNIDVCEVVVRRFH